MMKSLVQGGSVQQVSTTNVSVPEPISVSQNEQELVKSMEQTKLTQTNVESTKRHKPNANMDSTENPTPTADMKDAEHQLPVGSIHPPAGGRQ